jgi:hypothetical protein
MEKAVPPGSLPPWSELEVQLLGVLPLWLMALSRSVEGILVPSRVTAPVLHQALEGNGHNLVTQPRAAQEPAAWLKCMRDRELALPLCPGLLGAAWPEIMRSMHSFSTCGSKGCRRAAEMLLPGADWP